MERDGGSSIDVVAFGRPQDLDGEFDPGSGRTLAACLIHASRTRAPVLALEDPSGERVSNT